MHIKEIVLDGFKSYRRRTEITGFDDEFNVITGLNATGKSNILDSICFVLGVSNLSQVGAGSSQDDVIYKNGRAGVCKATVSITFDNRNKEQSPPGFEDYNEITVTRQVVMSGENKYMLNGLVVQNKRIQDLFCSVQLNVNNPNFLIMQGRITKVLNMQPPEILAMVEEAAGIRMYVTNRHAAQKTIGKMEAQLLELDKFNQEEIAPKLDKLREERTAYLEYQRIERELEHMMTLFQAWQYIVSQKNCHIAEKVLKLGQNKVQSIEDLIETNNQKIVEIDTQVEAMTQTIQSVGDKLKNLEVELIAREKLAAKAAVSQKSAKENIAAVERKKKQLKKNFKDVRKALKWKEQELEKVQGLFQQLKDTDEAYNQAFALSQKKYQAASIGMEVNDDGEAQTLQDQLMSAQQLATEANTNIKLATMHLEYLQTQLKAKQNESGTNALEDQKDKEHLETMEEKVRSLEKSLNNLSYSEEQMNKLEGHRDRLLNEIRTLQERVERFRSNYSQTNFQYTDPETNFNKKSVRGVVCRLFTLKDRTTATAVETAAGGRLYNVVVDTSDTSKKLLQCGNLKVPTTFIPLNKVQGGKLEENVVKFAQDLVGKENVQPALSLLNYDKYLQPVMESIFGNVFICKDLKVAREITFHDRIRRRCVTLDGEETGPYGNCSGGAEQKTASVLLQLEEITEYEKQLKLKEEDLIEVKNQIRQMSVAQEQWNCMTQELELKQYELGLIIIRQRLHHTTHHMQQEEIHTIKEDIGEWTEKMDSYKKIETESNKNSKELEVIMKDAKGHRERLFKGAEEEMKRLKEKADSSRKNWKQREPEYDILNLEILELRKGLENLTQQIISSKETLKSSLEQFQKHKTEAVEQKRLTSELLQQYKAKKASIRGKNKDVQKKNHYKKQLLAQITKFQLEIKKLDRYIKKLQAVFKTCKHKAAEYGKEEYDNKHLKEAQKLNHNSAKKLENKIKNLNEKRTELGRTVNAKAKSLLERAEIQYNELLKKKAIVESDKRQQIQIMTDLDNKNLDAIMLAWHQVSKDFGAICGTLLPGSIAKLQAPNGQTMLDGLEVKIYLDGVWKENLSQLSGGQRSLVALSLILAMLLFKPAPLYILDEIDAALDLPSTENIVNILKTHFKKSQFIIVSLKDGMLNNANVLFETNKCVNGVATVVRTINIRGQ